MNCSEYTTDRKQVATGAVQIVEERTFIVDLHHYQNENQRL